MKNKNKKFKSGVDKLYFAPITNIDYEKLDADPTDETAYTYGAWFRARGAERIQLDNQFASARTAADNNANYINQKKNNGYSGKDHRYCPATRIFHYHLPYEGLHRGR